jgi:branched-chain amino acid transport system substrate-binding protein
MKIRTLSFILVVLVFAITSCGKKNENIIKIGQYASLTGSEATFGISSDNGLKLAVE